MFMLRVLVAESDEGGCFVELDSENNYCFMIKQY